ncbi:DUF4893 domain-containing protein [Aestuariivirga sp.]|uniref:DUF4893 domain-containing protein n=1 Tax=Aestuariivirga sp. TaxID=2650926 RepID=UPI0039E3CDCC
MPAFADGELLRLLKPADDAKLKHFAATKAEALAEARAGGDAADMAILDDALSGTPMDINSFDATGPWRCRTIKAGGNLPLVTYGWFKCRISDDGSGWFLKKTTGSQRTEGRFYTVSQTRLAYLGAGYVVGESPRSYGEDSKENQVAFVERLKPNRLVLQFPEPEYESKFDILLLER